MTMTQLPCRVKACSRIRVPAEVAFPSSPWLRSLKYRTLPQSKAVSFERSEAFFVTDREERDRVGIRHCSSGCSDPTRNWDIDWR